MNVELINKILQDAQYIYDDIHKNSNILSEMLNTECVDYVSVVENLEDVIHSFLNKFDLFMEYLCELSFCEICDSSFDQLVDILKWNELDIFKLCDLYEKSNRNKLYNAISEINKYCRKKIDDTYSYNKFEFYLELHENKYISEFLKTIYLEDPENRGDQGDSEDIKEMILNKIKNNNDTNNNDTNDDDTDKIRTYICGLKLEKHTVVDLNDNFKHTFWNKNVLLFEFRNSINYDFVYVYLDIFHRIDKIQENKVIELIENKKYCIVMNILQIKEENYNEIFKNINDILHI